MPSVLDPTIERLCPYTQQDLIEELEDVRSRLPQEEMPDEEILANAFAPDLSERQMAFFIYALGHDFPGERLRTARLSRRLHRVAPSPLLRSLGLASWANTLLNSAGGYEKALEVIGECELEMEPDTDESSFAILQVSFLNACGRHHLLATKDFGAALHSFTEAREVAESCNLWFSVALGWRLCGSAHYELGEFREAIKCHGNLTARSIAEGCGRWNLLVNLYLCEAIAWRLHGNPSRASSVLRAAEPWLHLRFLRTRRRTPYGVSPGVIAYWHLEYARLARSRKEGLARLAEAERHFASMEVHSPSLEREFSSLREELGVMAPGPKQQPA